MRRQRWLIVTGLVVSGLAWGTARAGNPLDAWKKAAKQLQSSAGKSSAAGAAAANLTGDAAKVANPGKTIGAGGGKDSAGDVGDAVKTTKTIGKEATGGDKAPTDAVADVVKTTTGEGAEVTDDPAAVAGAAQPVDETTPAAVPAGGVQTHDAKKKDKAGKFDQKKLLGRLGEAVGKAALKQLQKKLGASAERKAGDGSGSGSGSVSAADPDEAVGPVAPPPTLKGATGAGAGHVQRVRKTGTIARRIDPNGKPEYHLVTDEGDHPLRGAVADFERMAGRRVTVAAFAAPGDTDATLLVDTIDSVPAAAVSEAAKLVTVSPGDKLAGNPSAVGTGDQVRLAAPPALPAAAVAPAPAPAKAKAPERRKVTAAEVEKAAKSLRGLFGR